MSEQHDHVGPRPSRPYMPGYGIVGPDAGSGLIDWAWARDRLVGSHDYWLATVSPAGHPHVMPVWGVWMDESLWFSSSRLSRKVRNLEHDPRTTATTDDALNPVVVEGTARFMDDAGAVERFTAEVNRKYEVNYSVEFFRESATLRLSPHWAFGLKAGDFSGSPTRWRWPAR